MGLKLKSTRFTLSTWGRQRHFSILRTIKPFEQITLETGKEVKNPQSVAGQQEIVQSLWFLTFIKITIQNLLAPGLISVEDTKVHQRIGAFFFSLNIHDFLFSSLHYLQHSLTFQLTLLHFCDDRLPRLQRSESQVLLQLELQKYTIVK